MLNPAIAAAPKNAEELLTVFQSDSLSGLRHTNFYHYTKIRFGLRILKSNNLRMTRLGKKSNDNKEQCIPAEKASVVFSTCFSGGDSENLPMWFLYAGVDGKGMRLSFSRKQLERLLTTPRLTLVRAEGRKKRYLLLSSDDYILRFKDIVYIGDDNRNKGKSRANYRGADILKIEQAEKGAIQTECAGFCKERIWCYEGECRAQVEIINPRLKAELCAGEDLYYIEWSLAPLHRRFRIMMGPNVDRETDSSVKKVAELLGREPEKSAYTGHIRIKGRYNRYTNTTGEK